MTDAFWPDYPRISAEELTTMSLDRDSMDKFNRRFLGPLIGAFGLLLLGFGGGYIWFETHAITGGQFCVLMATSGGFSIGIGAWRQYLMLHARPISVRSGLEMQPFIIADIATDNQFELAYVDAPSNTFFRKIHSQVS